MTLVRENNEYAGFLADWDHNLAFGQKQIAGGAFQVDRIDRDGKARPFITIRSEDNLTTGVVGMTADGKTLYMRDSRDRNTGALVAIDIATEQGDGARRKRRRPTSTRRSAIRTPASSRPTASTTSRTSGRRSATR